VTVTESYDGLREAIVANARIHGLAAALRTHGRDIIGLHASAAAPQRMLGRDLFDILTVEPELAEHFAQLPPEQAARLREELEGGQPNPRPRTPRAIICSSAGCVTPCSPAARLIQRSTRAMAARCSVSSAAFQN